MPSHDNQAGRTSPKCCGAAAYKSEGVTLIELMVVVAIISIIGSIAIPAYNGYVETSRKGECLNEVSAIQLVEEEFALSNNGTYFDGASPNELKTNSGNLYIPSKSFANSSANCTVSVTVNTAKTSYTISAKGTGKLPTSYTFTVGN